MALERRTYKVADQDGNTRLDRWCQRILGDAPNSIYQKAIRKGFVRLDGKKVDASVRVFGGMEVEVRGEVRDPEIKALPRAKQEMKMTLELAQEAQAMVLYKDKDILVINKPSGLAVQGGSKISKHLDGMLSALQFDGKQIPKLVHRLDKDTSGVMLLARHTAAAAELQRAFLAKSIRKTYLALVSGSPNPYNGEIESNLDKVAKGEDSHEMVRSVDEDGKRAITRYRTIEHLAKKMSLLELEPVTGRTHQLRVHMAEMKCPIIGDGKYGGRAAHVKGGVELSGKLHLQAWKIILPPIFGKPEREYRAPLAPHMQATFEALGLTLEE